MPFFFFFFFFFLAIGILTVPFSTNVSVQVMKFHGNALTTLCCRVFVGRNRIDQLRNS